MSDSLLPHGLSGERPHILEYSQQTNWETTTGLVLVPGSSVYGILKARVLEWVATSFFRGSSQPKDWTQGSCVAGRFFTIWATREVHSFTSVQFSHSVVSDSLQPHGLQHERHPCPSPTPGVFSNSCPLSRWCHPTISSSVIPFSSRL